MLEFVDVKEDYKQQLRKEILEYYYDNLQDDTLYEHLHDMNLEVFAAVDKAKTVELLVREGMCKEAFLLVSRFGPEEIPLGVLVRLCSRRILEQGPEEDEMLLYLCHYCFCHGKYDEDILSYLLSGYDGPMETMKTLWKAGKNFDLDTMALEEKILIMLAFERTGMEETEPIFESYRRKYGKKMLLAAYLNLMSYQYFVKEMDVQKPVFDEIERRMNASESVDPACRLAYLRYRTECGEASEKQLTLMSQILQECGDKHMCFGFFEKLPVSLMRTLQLMDRSIIEYRTDPKAIVMLTYTLENQEEGTSVEHTEMLHNVYEGIFEKDFTLFYGEKMVCMIHEEKDGKKTQSGPFTLLPRTEVPEDNDMQSRYGMLNEMCRAFVQKKETEFKAQAEEYLKKESLAEHFLPVR